MTKQTATRRFSVSHRHDPAEVQAEQAAEVVARGGSVSGWSFGSVPVSAAVHRDEKEEKEPRKATVGDLGEALSKTPPGKKLQEVVMDRPEVKAALRLTDERAFQIIAGAATLGGMGVAYGAKSDIMSKIPAIPIGTTGGYDVALAPSVKSPAGDPNTFGLTLTLSPSSSKSKSGSKDERPDPRNDPVIRSIEKARLAAENKSAVDELKKREEEPVQREPVSDSQSDSSADLSDSSADMSDSSIEGGMRGSGRPLEPATRHSMEARFGHDFSGVRLHDDAAANAAAASVSARAFTVGHHIVFGSGGSATTTPQGRYLLAHELAHVVQQRGRQGAAHLHRRTAWESFTIWLGAEEGVWTDQELTTYLAGVTVSNEIEGAYDADNKARAIVAKWKAEDPAFALTVAQKALLIEEMLDGPTLVEDETAILELLTLTRAREIGQLMTLIGIDRLEADLDFARRDQFDEWVAARFEGGAKALHEGKVKVIGPEWPEKAPLHDQSKAALEAELTTADGPAMIGYVALLPAADQAASMDFIVKDYWPRLKRERHDLEAEVDDPLDLAIGVLPLPARKLQLDLRIAVAEQVMSYYFPAQASPKEELEKRTKALEPELRKAAEKVLLPLKYPDRSKPGEEPKFKSADAESYRTELAAALIKVIDHYYDELVVNAKKRRAMSVIEAMAGPAKNETDAVLGKFYDKAAKPELVADKEGVPGNLHSWYAEADAELKRLDAAEATERKAKPKAPSAAAEQRRQLAASFAIYHLQARKPLREINEKFAASPDFDQDDHPVNKEAKIQVEVVNALTKDPETVIKLVEQRRAWGGAQVYGKVYVDLEVEADAEEDRLTRWRMFSTLIHEYIHTLVAPEYEKHAEDYGSGPEWNTLMEGVASFFTEMVWVRVVPQISDPGLREVVEGSGYLKAPQREVPWPARYASYDEVIRLVALVGLDNLLAAYFEGLVDRISVPEPEKPPPAKAKKKAKKAPVGDEPPGPGQEPAFGSRGGEGG